MGELDQTPTPIPGLAQVLKDVGAHLERYVVFANDYQRIAVSLWAAVTWAIDAFDVAPYILITAPERQSGKTRLLEVLEPIVRKPLLANSISSAALYRAVEKEHPTFLYDEIDAIYGPKAVGNEELRSLINAGHRRGMKTYRMGGGTKTKLESFDAFCVKALAGIDSGRHLPDTIVDRSILIRLQRRSPDEQLTRYRQRIASKEGKELASRLDAVLDGFAAPEEWPEMPTSLSDRATDIWEPLIVIADKAGGEWPDLAREAAESIFGTPDPADDSLGVRLLSDIRSIMKSDRITTSDLLEGLTGLDEAPWADLYGKAITARKLADLLRPFGIASHNIRTDLGVGKGYDLGDFASSWRRYLPREENREPIPYEPSLLDLEEDPDDELEAPF